MSTELLGVVAMYGITVLLAIPFGTYIAKVFKNQPNALDVLSPLERFIYRLGGVDEHQDLTWKQNLAALLTIYVGGDITLDKFKLPDGVKLRYPTDDAKHESYKQISDFVDEFRKTHEVVKQK